MKYTSHRSKRNRNLPKQEKNKKPFFSAKSDAVQTKADDAFFQTKLTIGQPNDKYEKEADAMADTVVNNSGNNNAVVQQKEADNIQRVPLSTPMDDEKLSTAEQRMERDKYIQEKPEEGIQKMEEEEESIQQKSESKSSTASPKLSNQLQNTSGKGQKMPKNTRAEMETAFGRDFSGVNIHTNEEAVGMNKNLGAQAFTHGKDVYFNAGKFQPETSKGKHLLAHELTHVVQQGGQQINRIQKFELEGPWNIGDPVHEHLTLYSLIEAGLVNKDTKYDADSAWEYTRGVIWNDDPEGLLFDNNKKENKNWSSGWTWKDHFDEGKTKEGKPVGKDDNLTARSHFGDLQFIHAMAQKDGEKAKETKSKMMMWAEFTYKVSIGSISETVQLKDIPVAGIPQLFTNEKVKNLTIKELFHVHVKGDTKKRAIGSLLHMIQDSFAEGHAEREVNKGGSKGAIKEFHSYGNQDGHKHGEKDAIQSGSKGTMRERIEKIPGAKEAIKNSALILGCYSKKMSWEFTKKILDTQIFKVQAPEKEAGAGKEFKK